MYKALKVEIMPWFAEVPQHFSKYFSKAKYYGDSLFVVFNQKCHSQKVLSRNAPNFANLQ